MQREIPALCLFLLAVGCDVANERFCDENSAPRSGQWCNLSYGRWERGENPNGDMSAADLTPPPDLTIICTSSADCTNPTSPVCNPVTKKCGPCNQAAVTDAGTSDECRGQMGLPFCNRAGACVECLANVDCLGKQKTCDPMESRCVACKKNTDCTSGLCLISQGMMEGSCEKPENLTYVNVNRCPGNKGRFEEPYCKVQDAITAMGGKPIVVAAGTYRENLLIDSSSRDVSLTILGLDEPVIQPAAESTPLLDIRGSMVRRLRVTIDGIRFTGARFIDGIRGWGGFPVSNTRVTLIRCRIEDSSFTGIFFGAGELIMDQCVVGPDNLFGGIDLVSANFSLTNLLVLRNGSPSGRPQSSQLGGIRYTSPPDTGALVNVSIVDNAAHSMVPSSGIECSPAPITISNTVVFGNVGGQLELTANCKPINSAFVGGSGMNNVDLTGCAGEQIFVKRQANDYHPAKGGMANCSLIDKGIDFLNGLAAPKYDLDGKPRPVNGKFDIGAYEAQ